MCRREFLSAQQRIFASDSPEDNQSISVSVADQEYLEQFLIIIFGSGLPPFNLSSECHAELQSLLCLSVFDACDADSNPLATKETCVDVRDRLCFKEWSGLLKFDAKGYLRCELLPQGPALTQECEGVYDLYSLIDPSDLNCMTLEPGINCT